MFTNGNPTLNHLAGSRVKISLCPNASAAFCIVSKVTDTFVGFRSLSRAARDVFIRFAIADFDKFFFFISSFICHAKTLFIATSVPKKYTRATSAKP